MIHCHLHHSSHRFSSQEGFTAVARAVAGNHVELARLLVTRWGANPHRVVWVRNKEKYIDSKLTLYRTSWG